jgi:GNAT superfamily N-acetyltransferase
VNVTLRRIAADEGHLLKQLRLQALSDTPSAFGSRYEDEARRTDEQWAARAAALTAGETRVTFIVFEDAEPVALAGGFREDTESDIAELVSMWVSPPARGKGYGSALIAAVTEWAAAAGCTLALWVTDGNEPARALYEAEGFVATGERQPLPSDSHRDEVRMVRPPSSQARDQGDG